MSTKSTEVDLRKVLYQRPAALKEVPTHYCSGCGHGILHRVLAEVLEELDILERCIGVAPVGCAVLAYDYIDVDWTEAAHGRPPAVATGLKGVHPDAIVFTYQGDGDLASIGMAETIHAANRGENITVIFVNNAIYGMTGGQMAPTTLIGQKSTTTPRGRDAELTGYPIRVCELLDGLQGPALLARTSVATPRRVHEAKRLLKKAFRYQMEGVGFGLVEVLSPCPTYWRMIPSQACRHIEETMTRVFPLGIIRDARAED
ncbi:MAG: thiamine pyrophosphate-dependent enzyme [Planctomycetota bacterium]|jgi:2-oxoglutarate ferredoxin oxidoreductase subunit beta